MPRTSSPTIERFWKHVNKEGPIPSGSPVTNGCWLWTGYVGYDGYGNFWDGTYTSAYKQRWVYPHRFIFAEINGPIPEGMEINHLCRTRNCVRPEHLELVSRAQNARHRQVKTHCIHGHEYSAENTRYYGGHRVCVTCRKSRRRPV